LERANRRDSPLLKQRVFDDRLHPLSTAATNSEGAHSAPLSGEHDRCTTLVGRRTPASAASGPRDASRYADGRSARQQQASLGPRNRTLRRNGPSRNGTVMAGSRVGRMLGAPWSRSAHARCGAGGTCRYVCPICHAKRLAIWTQWLYTTRLAPVLHRQVVLTIPKRLRASCLYVARPRHSTLDRGVPARGAPALRPPRTLRSGPRRRDADLAALGGPCPHGRLGAGGRSHVRYPPRPVLHPESRRTGTARLRPDREGRNVPVGQVRGPDGGHRDRRPARVPGPGAGAHPRQRPRHHAARWLVCQPPPWHAGQGGTREVGDPAVPSTNSRPTPIGIPIP
jgi:hypothetical protein